MDAVAVGVEESNRRGHLGLINLEVPGGNVSSIVVGSEETVLSFVYGHGNPPYYVSRGKAESIDPVFTCFLLFEHHTEFARRNVIPMPDGIKAAREFFAVNDLPKSVAWEEV